MVTNSPKEPFPEVPISEISIFRTYNPPGLFNNRIYDVLSLLDIPDIDFSKGDMTDQQKNEFLNRIVEFKRPLVSLALFHAIVAVEDLFRNFGASLADVSCIKNFFPNIYMTKTAKLKPNKPASPYKRPDDDEGQYFVPGFINKKYNDALGIEVIDKVDEARFWDLGLIRHTIAHHAGIVREIDKDRFVFYEVKPNRLINPPVEFAKETILFLYNLGMSFLKRIIEAIFSKVIPELEPFYPDNPPILIKDLIELFDYFSKIIEADISHTTTYSKTPEEMYDEIKIQSEKLKSKLMTLCVEEVIAKYGKKFTL